MKMTTQRPPTPTTIMRLSSTSSENDHCAMASDSLHSDGNNSQPSLALLSVSSSVSSSSSVDINSKPPSRSLGNGVKGGKMMRISRKIHTTKDSNIPLGKIVPLHPQPSLLDITHDEEDTSIDMDFHTPVSPVRRKGHSYRHGHVFGGVDKNCTAMTVEMTLETSIMNGDGDENATSANANIPENTSMMEKSLNISESLTSSFCNPAQCSLADCSTYLDHSYMTTDGAQRGNSTSKKKTLLSDAIVQNRVMEDFHFLLGSNVMPCWEERGLFSNCFGRNLNKSTYENDTTNGDSMGLGPVESNHIRNRAGESWRARAYRIKRLREERMSMDRCMQGYVRGNSERGFNEISDDRMGHLEAKSPLSRSTSYGPGSFYGRPDNIRNDKTRSKPKQEVNVEPLGCMIGDCIEPISPLEENGNEVDIECMWKDNHRQEFLDEQDLCYDSDPGIGYCDSEYELNLDVKQSSPDSSLLDNVTMLSSHGRSKSDSATPNTPTNRSRTTLSCTPKKKWSFRSPRRRRRRNFINNSFDEAMDGEKALRARGTGRARANSASENVKAEFYGNGAQEGDPNWSPPDHSFDELDINFKMEFDKKKVSVLDNDRDIVSCVQDALNSTWTLIWHHPSVCGNKKGPIFKTKSNAIPSISSGNSARCTQVWFERGNRIRHNDILEPKLMWRDAYHPDLVSERKLNVSTAQGAYKICLLSVCRILEMNHADRTRYPFTKISCSFMIKTSDDEEFVFEASSPKQRDAIVHTWKLVVARLASQAVVGDGEGMVGEFFVSSAFGVP